MLLASLSEITFISVNFVTMDCSEFIFSDFRRHWCSNAFIFFCIFQFLLGQIANFFLRNLLFGNLARLNYLCRARNVFLPQAYYLKNISNIS